MIRAMHYFAAACLILGYAYQLNIFYNVAAGLMLGFGVGAWIQYKYEQRAMDLKWEKLEQMEGVIKEYLKAKEYDSKTPDVKNDN